MLQDLALALQKKQVKSLRGVWKAMIEAVQVLARLPVSVCMCVCVYVCVQVKHVLYVCMYVCMYACLLVGLSTASTAR